MIRWPQFLSKPFASGLPNPAEVAVGTAIGAAVGFVTENPLLGAQIATGIPFLSAGARGFFGAIRGHLTARNAVGPEAQKRSLALNETLADIDRNFDFWLSHHLLKSDENLAEQLRHYRAEYARLKTDLEELVSRLNGQLSEEWRVIADLAEVFGIALIRPEPPDDDAAWQRAFAVLDEARNKLHAEDWAHLLQKRDGIVKELLIQCKIASGNARQLGVIIDVEFPGMETKARETFQTHRSRVEREDKKLKARQALHRSDDVSYALLDHAAELAHIAKSFIGGYYGVVSDVEARLQAASVAQYPELEPDRPSVENSDERERVQVRARAAAASQQALGGRP